MKDFENIENIEELDLLEIDSNTYENVLESVSREYDSDFVKLNELYEQNRLAHQIPNKKQSYLKRKIYKNLSEGIIGYINEDIPEFKFNGEEGEDTHLITSSENSDNREKNQEQFGDTSNIFGLIEILKGANKDNKDVLELLEKIEHIFDLPKEDVFILDSVFNIIEQIELLEHVNNSQALQRMLKEYIGYIVELLRYIYDLDKLEGEDKKRLEDYPSHGRKNSSEKLSTLNKGFKKIESISYSTKKKKVNGLLEYIGDFIGVLNSDLSFIMNDIPHFIDEYTKSILSIWNGDAPIYEIQDEILYSFPNYRIKFYQERVMNGEVFDKNYANISQKISSKRSEYEKLLNEYGIPYYTFNIIGSISDNIQTDLDEGIEKVINQSIEHNDEAQFAKNMLYSICMLASHNYNVLNLSYDDIKQTISNLEAYFNKYVNEEYPFFMFYRGLFERFFGENIRSEKTFRNFNDLGEISEFSALEVIQDEIERINKNLFEDKTQEIVSILEKYKEVVREQEGVEIYYILKMFIKVLKSNSNKMISNFGRLRSLIFEGVQNGSIVSEGKSDFSFNALFEGTVGDVKGESINEGIVSWIKSKIGSNYSNSNQEHNNEYNEYSDYEEDSLIENKIEKLFYIIEEKLGLEFENKIDLGEFLESFEGINDLDLNTLERIGDGIADIASVECYIPTMPKFYALNILDIYYKHEREYGDVTKVSKLSKLFNDINRDKRSLYDNQNDNQKEIEDGFKALFEADIDNFVANTTPNTSTPEGSVMIPISKYLKNEYSNTNRQGDDVIDFSKIVSDKTDVYNTPLYRKLKEESSPLIDQMTAKVNSYIEQLKGSKVQTWDPVTGALNAVGKTITGHDIIDKNGSSASKTSKQIEVGSELAKEWALRKNVIETAVSLYAKSFEETNMYKKGEEFIHYYVEHIVQSLLISYNSNKRNLIASYDRLDEMKPDEMAKAYILPDFFQAVRL